MERFDFLPGQFISAVAHDPLGKQQTRAYSIASAPRANQFDVCVNRVEGGFFSNLLCDLEVGQSLEFHGPHGLFLLRAPLTDGIFIATGTGIAPMRVTAAAETSKTRRVFMGRFRSEPGCRPAAQCRPYCTIMVASTAPACNVEARAASACATLT